MGERKERIRVGERSDHNEATCQMCLDTAF